MSNPQTVSIFTAKATNGIGAIVKTVERAEKVETEPVAVQVEGSWQAVTVKPQISSNNGANLTNVQRIKDDGTMVDIVITADAVFNVLIPSKAQLTLIVSGVGGTAPSLNAWALGNIVLVA